MKITRPDFVCDAHLLYLDALRESGAYNMFGGHSTSYCCISSECRRGT